MENKILIVEDDITFGTMLSKWFSRNGYEPFLCSNLEIAYTELKNKKYNLILSDLRLPDGEGIDILHWLANEKLNIPLIIMTSYAQVQSAVEAIKLGACDYLEKPIVPSILKEKIELALNNVNNIENEGVKQAVKVKAVKKDTIPLSGILVGESPASKNMYNHILKVAPTKLTVLLLGESGTGKEYAAKMIHLNSNRKDKPFIAVDCGSLSKELAPSELFGHLKGSFTSAIDNKKGVFEQANSGTVFLDEVGNLSYDVQVQLLRALQEQKIRSVGAAKDISIDVRIIAATNENLLKAIQEGRFREDLYHRLNEFAIAIPPLRDRGSDIMLYANEFLSQANEELEKNVKGFSQAVVSKFESNSWSGNLRELRNVVRRAVLFASEDEIKLNDLPALGETTYAVAENNKDRDLALRPSDEKERIEAALEKAAGNKSLAAQILKIDRKTLYNKIHQYGIKL